MVEPYIFPILEGMHTLMSFVGAVGVLMYNTGLKELLESAFGKKGNIFRKMLEHCECAQWRFFELYLRMKTFKIQIF